ncbi:MAG: hypothetical protein RIS45_1601 [Planctomycetota bacterium]
MSTDSRSRDALGGHVAPAGLGGHPTPAVSPSASPGRVLELFQCVPLATKLTRSSCGKRHLEAGAPGKGGVSSVRSSACRECPIGAAHARGETPGAWPSGGEIQRVGIGDLAVAPPPVAAAAKGRPARRAEGAKGRPPSVTPPPRDRATRDHGDSRERPASECDVPARPRASEACTSPIVRGQAGQSAAPHGEPVARSARAGDSRERPASMDLGAGDVGHGARSSETSTAAAVEGGRRKAETVRAQAGAARGPTQQTESSMRPAKQIENAGRLDLVLPVLLLDGVAPSRLGLGVADVAVLLAQRWPRRGPDLRRVVADGYALAESRARGAMGAHAYAAGDTLRRALVVQLGQLMAVAQTPDIVDQILAGATDHP